MNIYTPHKHLMSSDALCIQCESDNLCKDNDTYNLFTTLTYLLLCHSRGIEKTFLLYFLDIDAVSASEFPENLEKKCPIIIITKL